MGALGDLLARIEIGATTGIQIAGNKLKKQVKEASKQSVDFFYNAYSPSVPWNGAVYQRLYDINNAYKEFDSGGGKQRTVGTKFSSGYMAGGHRAGTDFILNNSWVNGFHGNPKWPTTVKTGSGKAMMDALFSVIKGNAPGTLYEGVAAGMHSVGL